MLRYTLRNRTPDPLQGSLAYSLTNLTARQPCHDNHRVTSRKLRGVQLNYTDTESGHAIDGSICIAVDAPDSIVAPNWNDTADRDEAMAFWDTFSRTGDLPRTQESYSSPHASVARRFKLPARAQTSVTFYITWHFPRRTRGWCGWTPQHPDDTTDLGNHYATDYHDAWDALRKITPRLPQLETKSRRFVQTLLTSTIPQPVRQALSANLSTLRTQTLFRTADGAFHGFEGCNDTTGSCFGDCNHVYNYEAATNMLFPDITRSLLDTVFNVNTDNLGANSFRTTLPTDAAPLNKVAADGTMGSIARLYRLYRLTGDLETVRRCWPAVKRIFDFTWRRDGWDGDRDGVME